MKTNPTLLQSALLLAVLLMIPATAQAQTYTYTNIYGIWYYTTNNGMVTITGYTGSTPAVSIPDAINDLPVTSIGEVGGSSSFYNSVTSVTIINSGTSIKDNAFSGCFRLTSVAIPNTVTNIGLNAFAECGLASVTFPAASAALGKGRSMTVA